MKKLFFYVFCALGILSMQAQIQVKGTVKDSAGNPITNANIVVVGKDNQGTVSDYDGNYSIAVEKGSSLSFKMVGYKTQNVKVLSNGVIDIVLQEDEKQLGEVLVSGQLHQNLKVVSSNRLGVRPVDMPTNTSRVDAFLIEEQMILKPSEAFMNVAGVYQFNQGYGGTGETVGARGLSLRYQGYMFRNGLRMGANQSGATPEMQMLEAVEVHKGASAINFGYTSIGAVINYVTKKPTFKNQGTVRMRAAQFGFYKPSLDLNVKVNEKLGLRFIGSYENAGSFRETLQSQRAFGFLAGKFLINNESSLLFNVDYLWDKTPRDFGLPIFETNVETGTTSRTVRGRTREVPVYKQTTGTQRLWANLDRTRFLGSPFNDRTTHQANANVRYELNLFKEKGIFKNWKTTINTGVSQAYNAYIQTGSGFRNQYKLLPDNDIEITRTLEKGRTDDRFISTIGNLTGEIAFNENITNRVSFSVDYDGRRISTFRFSNIANFDKITLKSSKGQKTTAPEHQHALKTISYTDGIGASLQNLVSLFDKVNVLLSLRYDNLEVVQPEATYQRDYVGRGAPKKAGEVVEKSSYSGRAWSTALGVVYKLTNTASVYASHLSGFELNRRAYRDENNDLLPGYNQYQWEVGVKQSWFNQKLNVNVGYYNIDTKSYLDTDGNRTIYEISNATTYKGYEVETAFSPIESVSVSINYTYIDARYAEGGSRKAGTRPQQTPEHQSGFNVSYRFLGGFLKNLNLNFSGQYTGERMGNDTFKSTRYYQDPYVQAAQTLLAAGANYTWKDWKFNLRGTNLADLVVYNSYRYGSVNPIAPRTITVGATYSF